MKDEGSNIDNSKQRERFHNNLKYNIEKKKKEKNLVQQLSQNTVFFLFFIQIRNITK